MYIYREREERERERERRDRESLVALINRVWDAVAVCISRETGTFPLCFCWYH